MSDEQPRQRVRKDSRLKVIGIGFQPGNDKVPYAIRFAFNRPPSELEKTGLVKVVEDAVGG
jgi:hypothetical protein